MAQNPYRYFKPSPEVTQHGVIVYIKFLLSLSNVEYMRQKRGVYIWQETIGKQADRFGTYLGNNIRKRRSETMRESQPALT